MLKEKEKNIIGMKKVDLMNNEMADNVITKLCSNQAKSIGFKFIIR